MTEQERLEQGELLVKAMTRPPMLGGFVLMSIFLSVYFPGMAALVTRSLYPLLLVPVALLASYLAALKDVYLFDIFFATSHLRVCLNKALWGCRSYAPR